MAGGGGLPPPPTGADSNSFIWINWYNQLSKYLQAGGIIKWNQIDFTGSDLGSLSTRLHSELQGVQGGIPNTEEYHLSAAQYSVVSTLPSTFVSSFNTRTGAVTLSSSDVTTALGYTPGTGSGTVSNVSVVTANGISGSVATSTTTPAITLTLGAITPTSVAVSGTITPSQTNGIIGTTTNNNANAGSIGEYVTATGTAVSLSNGISTNVTSISLTAGDWDVSANVEFDPAVTTVIQSGAVGINTVSATLPASPMKTITETNNTIANLLITALAPTTRVNISATTMVYIVANAAFTISTCTATGYIRARRVR